MKGQFIIANSKIEKLVFEHYTLLKEKYDDVHRS
jgi:hypothetical protein